MAREDFEIYFQKIANQYSEMSQDIRDMESLCATSMVSPEQIEQMKKTLQPIKDSYMSMSYVKYLLNLPSNKKTRTRNKRQYDAALNKVDEKNRGDSVLNRNGQSLSELKEMSNDR